MMIDFALEAGRNEGKHPLEAIHQACLPRFVTNIMTTMCAIVAGLPLALGRGTFTVASVCLDQPSSAEDASHQRPCSTIVGHDRRVGSVGLSVTADGVWGDILEEQPPARVVARPPYYRWLVVGTVCIAAFTGQLDGWYRTAGGVGARTRSSPFPWPHRPGGRRLYSDAYHPSADVWPPCRSSWPKDSLTRWASYYSLLKEVN
jgi:hypothetical protein